MRLTYPEKCCKELGITGENLLSTIRFYESRNIKAGWIYRNKAPTWALWKIQTNGTGCDFSRMYLDFESFIDNPMENIAKFNEYLKLT